MNLLITGGAGFIGSNFVEFLMQRHPEVRIINLDKLTYAGSIENLKNVKEHPRHLFIEGDIYDRPLLESMFEEYQIDGVIHFAAESHVDNSIKDPMSFINTNIVGTANLLDVAKNHWMNDSGCYKPEYAQARFHHISTDEVYGTLGSEGYFTEDLPYAPSSPYSASKASSDMLVRSYHYTYGMNVVTTNCSNNYGPHQHDEKLIPTIIRKALAMQPIPIYGDGENIRDWLYVIDHCRAIEKVFFEGQSGETYLIGGHCEKTNLEIVEVICNILDEERPVESNPTYSYKELVTFVEDRPGHDFRYAIDDSKLRNELSFSNDYSFKRGIRETVLSYL